MTTKRQLRGWVFATALVATLVGTGACSGSSKKDDSAPPSAAATLPSASAPATKTCDGPKPATVTADPDQGIAAGDVLVGQTKDEVSSYFKCMTAAGLTWIRTDFKAVDLDDDQSYQEFSKLATDASLKIHAIFNTVSKDKVDPACIKAGAEWYNCMASDPAADGKFWVHVLEQFAGIKKVEIGNEVNLEPYYVAHPAKYWDYYLAVYKAIKAAYPDVEVLPASTAPVGENSDESMRPEDWYKTGYAHGLAGHFSSLGMHPYTWPALPVDEDGTAWHSVVSVHALMASHGDGGKLIDLTEMGWPTGGEREATDNEKTGWSDGLPVTERVQGLAVKQTVGAWHKLVTAHIAGIIEWYSLVDHDTADHSDTEAHFGLVRDDLTPKSGWTQLQQCNSKLTRSECGLAA